MITTKEQKDYIEGGASNCPKCKSDEIEVTLPVDSDGVTLKQEILCLKCHTIWIENYELVSID